MTRATSSSPSTSYPRESRDDVASRPQPRRPQVPKPRRRRQAACAATLPRMDRSQRVRPGRDPDRDVRVHGRPDDLQAQPGARPQLRQVPRVDRRAPVPADRGDDPGHLLALRAAGEPDRGPRRRRSRHATRRREQLRCGVHDQRRTADRALRAQLRLFDPDRGYLAQPHRCPHAVAVLVLLPAASARGGAPVRALGRRAELRREPPLRLRDRRRRRRSGVAAARVGVLQRRRLGRMRARQ